MTSSDCWAEPVLPRYRDARGGGSAAGIAEGRDHDPGVVPGQHSAGLPAPAAAHPRAAVR